MSEEPCFRVTAGGLSDEALEAWAIEWLRVRGWRVTSPHEWETPKELCLRLGISSAHLSRSLRKPRCPKPFDLIAGQMGRIVWLKSTKDLEEFLVKFRPNENRASNSGLARATNPGHDLEASEPSQDSENSSQAFLDPNTLSKKAE